MALKIPFWLFWVLSAVWILGFGTIGWWLFPYGEHTFKGGGWAFVLTLVVIGFYLYVGLTMNIINDQVYLFGNPPSTSEDTESQ